MGELVLGRKVGVDRPPARRRGAQQRGQAMVALRADDHVHRRLAAHDLRALGLGDAAGDHDGRPAAEALSLILEFAQLAELRIDLLGRPFADMAGVEDDQVGILGALRFPVALRRRQIGHALRVVDVHLAAEGLNERAGGLFRSGRIGAARIVKRIQFGQEASPGRPFPI